MASTFSTDDGALQGWTNGDGAQLALVLHGGPGMTDYTEGLATEVLAGGDGSLRVARYQQRGQAPSTLGGPQTVAQHVADACTVMDALGAARAVIVGHSWGGHLAMHIAAVAPERVAGLLLVDSLAAVGDGGTSTMGAVIGARIGESGQAALAELPTLDLSPETAAARELAIIWPGYFSHPEAAPPMPPIELSGAVNAAVMSDAMRLLEEGALERALATLDIPSLHAIGAHSPIDPAANQQSAALMKNAMVELLDTGHFPWLEQPGTMEAATRRLLAALPGR